MRIETILNAMVKADRKLNMLPDFARIKHIRQYRTFRDRILRIDAEKDAEIELWKFGFRTEHLEVTKLRDELAEKDHLIEKYRTFADQDLVFYVEEKNDNRR